MTFTFQVHTFDELFTINLEHEKFRGGHLLKGRLNNSSIYIGPNCSKYYLSNYTMTKRHKIRQNTAGKSEIV